MIKNSIKQNNLKNSKNYKIKQPCGWSTVKVHIILCKNFIKIQKVENCKNKKEKSNKVWMLKHMTTGEFQFEKK